jgi:uncharacterized protein (DUF1800 family)
MAKRGKTKITVAWMRPEGAGFLAGALCVLLTLAAPYVEADKKNKKDASASEAPSTHLSKSFKGKLPITQLNEEEAILHAMDRLAYGPRPGDIERIRQTGLEKWIDRQLSPEAIDDSAMNARLTQYSTLKMSPTELLNAYPDPGQVAKKEGLNKEDLQQKRQEQGREAMEKMREAGITDPAQLQLARIQGPQRILVELSMARLTRAVYSERQLDEVMSNFWYNHFNVFWGKGPDRWMVTSYERDAIRPHAIGKFQDLLEATAKSPAMLFYLDNWLSADPVAFQKMQAEMSQRRQRFEGMFNGGGVVPPSPRTFPQRQTNSQFPPNQARRFPQMPAAGVQPPKRPERGLNENYGRELMELHTLGVDGGYSQADVIQVAKCFTGWSMRTPQRDPQFFFDDRVHAAGPKMVMGKKIDGGGMKDGEQVLRMLAHHPSTARFISTELARHFVSDNPPVSLVKRMAQTFQKKDGDIRAVLRTMIYSPEFWSRAAYRSKVKTPFELVASTARALGADIHVPLPMVQWVGRMGEPLYLCLTPNGYSDKADAWVNTGALLNRLNFALALASNHMNGAEVNLAQLFGPEATSDPQMALARALDIFLDGQVSPQSRDTLEKRLADPQVLQARLDDPVRQVNVGLIAGLVLGSPEFQRR